MDKQDLLYIAVAIIWFIISAIKQAKKNQKKIQPKPVVPSVTKDLPKAMPSPASFPSPVKPSNPKPVKAIQPSPLTTSVKKILSNPFVKQKPPYTKRKDSLPPDLIDTPGAEGVRTLVKHRLHKPVFTHGSTLGSSKNNEGQKAIHRENIIKPIQSTRDEHHSHQAGNIPGHIHPVISMLFREDTGLRNAVIFSEIINRPYR